jgi:GT2 family glycosyltransferase
MVAVAQGTFILLLNNDAVLHKDALKTLYDASQKFGDGIFGLPQYDADTGELIDIGSTFDPFLNPIPNKDRRRQDVGMIIGACLWLPRILWDKLGGFPEWFGSLAEDMYFCCFARLMGYPVKALPESGFDHWVGRSLGGGKVIQNRRLSTTFRRRIKSERNKTYVMLICYPSISLLLIFPLHILMLCLEGFALSLIKRDRKIWKEIYWNCAKEVWSKRTQLWQLRGKVQPLKCLSQRSFFYPFSIFPHKLRMMIKHGLPNVAD